MKKRSKEKFLTYKLLMCIVYLIVITILFVCSYQLVQEHNRVIPWSEVESTEDYTYIDISKMSEKFAYYKDTNIGIHFVIEKEDTGLWHTYLIAINEDNYDRYKKIIDYTYERTKEEPRPIRVYGYPVVVDEKIMNLAIKNIPNFVPNENEVTITKDNYNDYLTNSYLDTTKSRKNNISITLAVTLTLLLISILLLISTIISNDKNKKRKKKAK